MKKKVALIGTLFFVVLFISVGFAADLPLQKKQSKSDSLVSPVASEDQIISEDDKQPPNSPKDEKSNGIAKRGCCAWHNGVCGCRNGRVVCCDGTLSPTCTCSGNDAF